MNIIRTSTEDVVNTFAKNLGTLVSRLQQENNQVCLGLTGGTIAQQAYTRISADSANWHAVQYYWGDERFVPSASPQRNEVQARQAFLDRLRIPNDNIHPMAASDEGSTPWQAAEAYAARLPKRMALIILGLGPDGHIASLFPGFDQVEISDKLCVPVDNSPKPPAQRISLTFPALLRADQIWFIASGREKAAAVARAQSTKGTIDQTPARGVLHALDRPGSQDTYPRIRWYLDDQAAADLP